jgi:type 1 glutamine amidotransferase
MNQKIRALVLCDDAWHPAVDVQSGLNALADRFDFAFVTDGEQWSPALMKDYPLVLIAKANHLRATDRRPWLTEDTQSAFRTFVQDGGGLFLIHGGTCNREFPEMRAIAGGAFLRHPDQCLVTADPTPAHPLTANVKSFTETDEHYIMALDGMEADVFLRTRSKHGSQPAGWTRTEGKGRVGVLTPGHNRAIWLHPDYQTLIRNGLVWLAKSN